MASIKNTFRLVLACILISSLASAQTATLGSATGIYDAKGGVLTLTATVIYPATANTVGGVVVAAGGSGYSGLPTVTFSGGGGAGATATAEVTGGAVTAVRIVNPGAGYTSPPVVIFSGGGGTGVTANAVAILPQAIGFLVKLPSGWGFASQALPVGAAAVTSPAVGDSTLEWGFLSFPAERLRWTFDVSYPPGLSASQVVTVDATQSAYRPGPLSISAPALVLVLGRHSADSNGDGKIDLAELTRVIQLYNTRNGTVRTGRYLVQASGSEDGFSIDGTTPNIATVSLARYHTADSDKNGKITLVELTRVIELYSVRSGATRTGAYLPQDGTEDGFAPAP